MIVLYEADRDWYVVDSHVLLGTTTLLLKPELVCMNEQYIDAPFGFVRLV